MRTILNEIIMDTDNEIGRLCSGNDISRTTKRINKLIAKHRAECKHKLTEGSYTYLNAITHTIGKVNALNTEYSDESDESAEEESIETTNQNNCVVCLTIRITTCVFLPCKHASFCTDCTKRIEELGHPCPICRTPIENSFQIYTN